MKNRMRVLWTFLAVVVAAGFLYTTGPAGCGGNCGNGTLEEGEACDDGNQADGDGCDSSCETETPSGTTGGGTTGGTATGGTTGGSGSCTTPADCPASFSETPVCEHPSTCQGSRVDATCFDGVCGSTPRIPDDSGCTAESFTKTCGTFPDASCDGTVAQAEAICPPEICDDGNPTPGNDNVDNDGDGLINCADVDDCPENTQCTTDLGSAASCINEACQD